MPKESENDDGKIDVKTLNETMKTIAEGQKGLVNLPNVLNQMGTAINAITAKIEGMATNKPAVDSKPTVKEPIKMDDQVIDDMTGSQLAAHIISQIGDVVKDAVKPVSDKVDDVDVRHQTGVTKSLLNKAVDDHKDFWSWKDEMTALAGQHPSLTPQALYTLARDENPDKATEIDKELAKKNDDLDDDGKKKEEPQVFGGLTPTSGVSGKEGKSDMKSREAAESAWEQTMKEISPDIIGGTA